MLETGSNIESTPNGDGGNGSSTSSSMDTPHEVAPESSLTMPSVSSALVAEEGEVAQHLHPLLGPANQACSYCKQQTNAQVCPICLWGFNKAFMEGAKHAEGARLIAFNIYDHIPTAEELRNTHYLFSPDGCVVCGCHKVELLKCKVICTNCKTILETCEDL